MSSRLEDLERLARLREAGALTEEEFAAEKAKVLSGQTESREPISRTKPAQPTDGAQGPASQISPKDALEQAGRAWLSATALIAASAIGGGAAIYTQLRGGPVAGEMAVAEALPLLVLMFALNVALTLFLAWLAARRRSMIAAWLLLLSSAGSVLLPLVDDPMQDGLAVLFALVALAALATWEAWLALRGVSALRKLAASSEGRLAIEEARVERASQPRPTGREALAFGFESTREVRKVLLVVGIVAAAAIAAIGAYFWFLDSGPRPAEAASASSPYQPSEPQQPQPAASPETDPSHWPPLYVDGRGAAGDITAAAWVQEGGSCASDQAISFDRDGTFHGYATSGTWRQVGQVIELIVRESYPDEQPGPWEHVRLGVGWNAPDEPVLQWGEDAPQRYRSCPYRGSDEPWGQN